jgi:MFS family permease
MTDRGLLYVSAFTRAVATGTSGVLLGTYLARLGVVGAELGLVVAAGLAGSALAAVLATFFADRWGRRRFLIGTAMLSVLGMALFALAHDRFALTAAAFLGMVNGMGKDRGAALILEQAALPATAGAEQRTRAIAWYTMLQDVGHALGALLSGAPSLLAGASALPGAWPQRATLLGCALLGLLGLAVYTRLGPAVEAPASRLRQALTPASRRVLGRISALFAIDSLAGGFLTAALLSYFFFERFGASELAIGLLFFGARIMNAASHLGAAWLAARIGLVNTMVFTHIPSSLLLMTVAFAPSFPVAALLFLLREGLVEMDVPTRQSYVLAVVLPEERTFASGVTNLVRVAAWAVAPTFAAALMAGRHFYLPLVVGGAMKIGYDVLLWAAFRKLKPPEELARATQ